MDDRLSLQWAGQGNGGAGKTHFLLSAPGPIFVHLFDPRGIEPLVKRPEFAGKDIRWCSYNFNPGKLAVEDRPKAAQDALALFLANQAVALKNARTIGFDKEDHVYEMLRYARLEAFSGRPASYYELNLEYRGWFADAAEAGVNLGAIRGMKEKWGQNAKGQPIGTGEMIPRGQREVNELVQVVLDHRFDEAARRFKVRIHEKCRVGPATDLIGEEFSTGAEDTDLPDGFLNLAQMLYPGTTAEEWGY